MTSSLNEILSASGFLLALMTVIGYSIATFSLVHEKSRVSSQISILTVLPVSILAFYLFNLPLFSLMSPVDLGSHNSIIWYRLAAISIFSSLIVAATMQERSLVSSTCFMVICVSLLATAAYAISINFDNWLTRFAGYRDTFAAGPLHSVAGGFALGVIVVLRARLYQLNVEQPRQIPANNPAGVFLGLTLLLPGMLGFKLAFLSFNDDMEIVNVYGQLVSIGTVISNNLAAFAVGMVLIILLSKNNFYCALCGGLAGMSSIAAVADIYTTQQSILVSIMVVSAAYITSRWLLSRGIDDLISAAFVHGFAGFYGLIVSGFLMSGEIVNPSVDSVLVSILGQIVAAVIMFIFLGFIPGFAAGWLFRWLDILRMPQRMEILGIDIHQQHRHEIGSRACIKTDLDAVEQERLREVKENAADD